MTRRSFFRSAIIATLTAPTLVSVLAADPCDEHVVIWGQLTDSRDWVYDSGDYIHLDPECLDACYEYWKPRP